MIHALQPAASNLWKLVRAGGAIVIYLVLAAETVRYINGVFNPYDGFKPLGIEVPDHCAGENPKITVRRESTKSIDGWYRSDFENQNRAVAPFCPFNSLVRAYRPRLDTEFESTLYDYFRGGDRGCSLPPGRYVGGIHWTFRRPWHPDTNVSVETNPFTVFRADDPRCQKEPSP